MDHGHMPLQAMLGWTEGLESRNDAVEMAKGFITRRYTAVEASWYAVAPFMGGWFWEVHEGGPGKGCVGSVVDALSRDPGGKFWFPSGDRAFQVMMRDGKPYCILLSKADSLPVINSGEAPLAMVTRMTRAVRRGAATFAAGVAMLGSGAAFMLGSMAFFALAANPGPSLSSVNFSMMPHAQWNQVATTGVEEIVSRLYFADGSWKVERRAHEIPGLAELRDQGQELRRAVKDSLPAVPEVPDDAPSPAVQPMPSNRTPLPAQQQRRIDELRRSGQPANAGGAE